MKLYTKYSLILVVVGVTLSGAHNHDSYREKIREKYCGGDETCVAVATKCLTALKPSDEEFKAIAAAFKICLAELGLEETYNEFKQTHAHTDDNSESHSDILKGIKIYGPFMKHLEEGNTNPDKATEFRCCFGQATNTIKTDKAINVDYLKEKITAKVSDVTVREALLLAVDACPAQTSNCNSRPFRKCAIDNCITKLKS